MSKFYSNKKFKEKNNEIQSRKNNNSSDTDSEKHNNAEVLSSSPPFKSTLLSCPVDFSVPEYQFAPTMHNSPICLPSRFPLLSEIEASYFPTEFNVPLPKNQAEVYLRSELILKCSRIYKKILDALFQNKGRITETNSCILYIDKNGKSWAVNLKGDQTIYFSIHLPLGGWINISTGEYGFDILSLCSAQLRCNYTEVYEILGKNMGVDVAPTDGAQKDELAWWIQEKTPISNVPLPYFHQQTYYQCQIIHESRYWHTPSILKGIVLCLLLPSGEELQLYKTLWRHHKSQFLYWMELFPQAPYMLYNEHLLTMYLESQIIFVDSEREADHKQSNHHPSSKIFTSCPGGLKNLQDIDLSSLNSRNLIIIMKGSNTIIPNLPNTIKRIKDAGAKGIMLSFNNSQNFVSADDFIENATKWGYNHVETEQQSSACLKILRPYEKAEGEDKVSELIAAPCFEEKTINMICGAAKSWKTMMSYNLAYAISKGNTQVGIFKTQKPYSVFYVDGEMRSNKVNSRIEAIKAGQNDDSEGRPFSLYLVKDESGKNHKTDFLSGEWQQSIEKFMTQNKIKVVFFDNLHSLMGRQSHLAQNAFDWFSKLNDMGITVIAIDHHSRKGDIQGSISKERDADLVISLDGDEDEGLINVSFPFVRHFDKEELKEHVLKPESGINKISGKPEFRFQLVGEDSTEFMDNTSDKVKKIAFVVYLNKKADKKLTYKEIDEIYGIKYSTAQNRGKDQLKKLDKADLKQFQYALDKLNEKYKGNHPSIDEVSKYL